MPRNNPSGKNGHGVKNYPADEILKAALLRYSREKLSVNERLARLESEHGLSIGKSKLMALNNKFRIPSTRKPPPDDIAIALVLREVEKDKEQKNGVGAIGAILRNNGTPVPRDFIREVLAVYAPEGLAARFPGGPDEIKRLLGCQ